MGNYEETKINEEELKPYLKEGLTMSDLINLKKHLFHQIKMKMEKQNMI